MNRNGSQYSSVPSGRKPFGITPTTVTGPSLVRTTRPTMPGSPPKRRFQRPWERTIAAAPPGAASSGAKLRPSAGETPRTEKRFAVTARPAIRSGGPVPTRVSPLHVEIAMSSNTSL